MRTDCLFRDDAHLKECMATVIGWTDAGSIVLHLPPAVLPYPVTGGDVGDGEGRLDFDIPEAGLEKDDITGKLAAMIEAEAEVRSRWIR